MLYRLLSDITTYLDRLIESHGLGERIYLSFHPEWSRGYLDAWADANGRTARLWRWELEVSKPVSRTA